MLTITKDSTLLLARHLVASAVAQAMASPRAPSTVGEPQTSPEAIRTAWALMAETYGGEPADELGLGELPPELAHVEPLISYLGLNSEARAEVYQQVFGLVTQRDCPPYETEYCHWADPTYRAQQMADVAGFYRAFGIQPNPNRPERHDHASLEIEYVAFLLQKCCVLTRDDPADERVSLSFSAIHDFIRDHIAWWVPTFGHCLERRAEKLLPQCERTQAAPLEHMAGVGRLLRAWTAVERMANGVEPSRQVIAPMVDQDLSNPEEMTCGGCASEAPA